MPRRRPKPASAPRPEEAAFLQSIVDNPHDEGLWLILADWLEEHDDPRRAELLRLHRQLIATCCEPDKHPERAGEQARIVQLLTEGVQPSLPRQTLTLGKDVEMTFAWIPPGSFLMGSPEREEDRNVDETQHRVTLTRGFWLALTPVTQRQWRAVMGSNPSHFRGKDLPVDTVSWDDCQAFCRRLGEGEAKSVWLPTDAQWEYACRAGATTPFFFGETLSTEQANYNGNYPYGQGAMGVQRHKTTAAGSFAPNAWGLYDMHGNVWEWASFQQGSDPGSRGGNWNDSGSDCRAARRDRISPGNRRNYLGFRLAHTFRRRSGRAGQSGA